jgi:hypothetical protein
LQHKNEQALYEPLSGGKQECENLLHQVARQNRQRSLLSLAALHDLVLYCICNPRKYRLEKGKHAGECEIRLNRLEWSPITLDETLDVDGGDGVDNTARKGTPILKMGLRLQDPLGRLLDEAQTWKEAGRLVASVYITHLNCALPELSDTDRQYFEGSLELM